MDFLKTRKLEIKILKELYGELEEKLEKAGKCTEYLEVTAGMELFDTDCSGLSPCVSYVFNELCEAENILYGRS